MRTLSDFELSKVLDTLKNSVENLELATAISQLEDKIAECLDRIGGIDRAWAESVVRKGCYDIAPDGCSFENRYINIAGHILLGPEYSTPEPFATALAGRIVYLEVKSIDSVEVRFCNSMQELVSISDDYSSYIIPLYNFKQNEEGDVEVVDLRFMPRADAFATIASLPSTPSEQPT